jgi:hypothetical protein
MDALIYLALQCVSAGVNPADVVLGVMCSVAVLFAGLALVGAMCQPRAPYRHF